MGGGLMGFWTNLFRGSADAVPVGAYRPSMTQWFDPAGIAPPVSWIPANGQFETHWDYHQAWALAIPGVWQARRLISQSIGAMPLGEWRGSKQQTATTWLTQPNPGEDRANTVAAWTCDLLDHGNAVGLIATRYATGEAQHVLPLPCTSVAIGRGEDTGQVFYEYNRVRFGRSEIFHAKGISMPGDLRGMGVLEAGLSTIDRMTAEQTYASKAFTSGTPSGLLKVRDPDLQPGTDDDPAGYVTAKGIKKAWKDSISTGDIAVMSELIDFTPLSWTPSDAQMVEARQLSLVDVANLYGLDPFWLGSSQVSAPYQNVQDAAVQMSRFTLGFWITVLEAEFSRFLVRGTHAKFNRDTILRDTQAQRIANYAAMIGMGMMTVDEARANEGLPPLEPAGEPASVTPLFPGGDPETNEQVTA